MKTYLIALALCLGVSLVSAGEKDWPKKGDIGYIPAFISVPLPYGDLANEPIPYENLDCKYTNQCHYKVLPCGPLKITGISKKRNLLYLNVLPEMYSQNKLRDGVLLVMSGLWKQALFSSEEKCLKEFSSWSSKYNLSWNEGVLFVKETTLTDLHHSEPLKSVSTSP